VNRLYRSIWNPALGAWVAASELVRARGQSSSKQSARVTRRCSVIVALAVPVFSSRAVAQTTPLPAASGIGYFTAYNQGAGSGFGFGGDSSALGKMKNNGGDKISFSIGNTSDGAGAHESAQKVTGGLQIRGRVDGTLLIYSPDMQLHAPVNMERNIITGLAPGAVAADSTDAINGAQLSSLSTAVSTGIGSLSTGLSTTAGNVSSLSTVVADSVQYDSPDHTKVTLGGANSQKPVALGNVADGVQPTDAVNVSQLTSLSTSASTGIGSLSTGLGTINSNVSSLSTSVVGGMDSLSTGLSTTNGNLASLATSVSTGIGSLSTGVANVGAQIASLSTGLYDRARQIGNINGLAADMKGTGVDKPAVTAGANSVAIGANSNDGGRRNVVSIGSAAQQRQLVNVAEGTQGTDAVNLDQLNRVTSDGMRQANSYTDRRIAGVQQSIDQTARNAYSGIAAVTALSMIGDVDKDKTIALGVGVGTYRGYQAIAVSATARLTDNLRVRAGAGVTSGSSAAGVGATMQW
jgi:trimeric autotransporter adhesin